MMLRFLPLVKKRINNWWTACGYGHFRHCHNKCQVGVFLTLKRLAIQSISYLLILKIAVEENGFAHRRMWDSDAQPGLFSHAVGVVMSLMTRAYPRPSFRSSQSLSLSFRLKSIWRSFFSMLWMLLWLILHWSTQLSLYLSVLQRLSSRYSLSSVSRSRFIY